MSEEGNSACLSSCSEGLRALFELCAEPTGVSGRCTGVSVPLRVVPSPTGLPSKRGPGLGSFSRADRGLGGVRHVAPPTWLHRSDSLRPHGLYVVCQAALSAGKNIGVGCHSLLHGIFLSQGSNPGLLHCKQILYHLSHQGSPHFNITYVYKVAYHELIRFPDAVLLSQNN